MEAYDADPCLDGLPFVHEAASLGPPLGPRQLLLESAPCSSCGSTIATDEPASLVCDRCNAVFHLRCTGLHQVPATYWYCKQCRSLIHGRGIRCPTEDIALQQYLLSGSAPPALRQSFAERARDLSFTDRLYIWRSKRWMPWPSVGHQLLLMEDVHIQLNHIGGDKMAHVLA